MGTSMQHAVVARDQWIKERQALLEEEKKLMKLRDKLNAKRRALPWVRVEKEYVFTGPEGEVTLSELFGARSQLFIKHFMLAPGQTRPCVGCSLEVDHIEGILPHIENHDVAYVVVARAPIDEIEAVRKRMGWRFRWVSSYGSDFNYDFNVSFKPEDMAAGQAYYNFRFTKPDREDLSGDSVFFKDDDGRIFHTYSCFGRGGEEFLGIYSYFDVAPRGRNETGPGHNLGDWARLHDMYAQGAPLRDCCAHAADEHDLALAATTRVDGHEVYYEWRGNLESGETPILLLHGGLNSIETNFPKLFPRFAKTRPVIAVEQQGHGHTADRDTPISLPSMRRDTLAVLDRLHVDRVHVVGYSVGGMLALELAIFAPQRVASLTAISASAGTRGMLPELVQMNRNPSHFPSRELEALLPSQDEFAAMRRNFAVNPSGAGRFDVVRAKMSELIAGDWGWSQTELQKIHVPVLILIGDRDFILPQHAVEMASTIPHAQLAILPGTTHMNILERADWIVPMIELCIGHAAP
jgi:predicted dithiol-disulfide oxidoreductase (DUF899 family)/alpha-beta hydrolase superfamily lysophospholipase